MFLRLFLLFTLVPLAELALLIELGRHVGVLPTIAVCMATGAVGAWLARSQGLATLERARQSLASGRFPGEELAAGVAIVVGGALLLTPGLLTDGAGFLLLIPASRRLLIRHVRRRWELKHGIVEIEAG